MFLFLQDAVYHTIDMRFVAVEQMSQLVTLAGHRGSVRLLFQAENRFFEALVPSQGRVGVLGIDLPIQLGKVALRTGSDVNAVCHA